MIQIEFNQKIKNKIKELCLKNQNQESCGLVLFNEKTFKFDVFPCKNKAQDKNNNFIISPQDYLRCASLGKITACYHSHNDDNIDFSEIDKQNSNKYNIFYILYNTKFDIFKFYQPNSEKNNYIGRPFLLGKLDCFTLAQEYFLKEENINIYVPSDHQYPKALTDIKGLYEDHFESQGFIRLDKNIELKKSDAIMMIFSNISETYPTHVAMYIGDNLILHQPYNAFSCVNLYSSAWKKHTSYILRHRSKV